MTILPQSMEGRKIARTPSSLKLTRPLRPLPAGMVNLIAESEESENFF
jgi:hypothetical protein